MRALPTVKACNEVVFIACTLYVDDRKGLAAKMTIEEVGMDVLDKKNLAIDMEDHFGISITDDEIDTLLSGTTEQIAKRIRQRLKAREAA